MEKKEEAGRPVEETKNIYGEVRITVSPNGAMQLMAPQNNLVTLAILEGAKAIVLMQLQDSMRRSNATRPPAIVKAGADALKNLSSLARPS